METLAYYAFTLFYKEYIYSAWWEPKGTYTDVREFVFGIFLKWNMAWRRLELYSLGCDAWRAVLCDKMVAETRKARRKERHLPRSWDRRELPLTALSRVLSKPT